MGWADVRLKNFRERPSLHVEGLGVDCLKPLETRQKGSRRLNNEKESASVEYSRGFYKVLV